MRLILLALIGFLCLAFVHGQDFVDGDERVNLLDVADQGAAHAVNGDREARGYGGGHYGGGGRYGGGRGGHYGR
ncbi:uncharacterized protein F12A10.7-like [Drosophila pseudoobscura]|uniref:Uncharacterized protein F12A10.7-like n=1 Tax=Drosophila pseudoobscura pseudoobscura TaxID=46245 RepID=A0A6I8V4E7_DROPS|nr:uncharacterized protein F12A10.7 [Drosophila pseudoobscura]